jgi:hypothetical protein
LACPDVGVPFFGVWRKVFVTNCALTKCLWRKVIVTKCPVTKCPPAHTPPMHAHTHLDATMSPRLFSCPRDPRSPRDPRFRPAYIVRSKPWITWKPWIVWTSFPSSCSLLQFWLKLWPNMSYEHFYENHSYEKICVIRAECATTIRYRGHTFMENTNYS